MRIFLPTSISFKIETEEQKKNDQLLSSKRIEAKQWMESKGIDMLCDSVSEQLPMFFRKQAN